MNGGAKYLGCAAVACIAGLILAITLLAAMAAHDASAGCGGGIGTGQPGTSTTAEGVIPANYLTLYKRAGRKYGIPWNILAAIGYRESTHGANPGASSAGALGPMQFMPATWNTYGVDGDGDGRKDIMDPADAIPAAAHYLKASGAPAHMEKALWAYNNSHTYYRKVMATARSYATGDYTIAGANPAGTGTCVPGGGPATRGNLHGTLGQRIVAYASKWIGIPYQFAGGNPHGPTVGTNSNGSGEVGFDCSGLTLYAVYQATGGKVRLLHYVPHQWWNPHVHRVGYSQLHPGDLVALHHWGHVGIYIGGGKMIHAPHTGDVVKISDITPGTWYYNVFITGGRIVL